MLRTLSKLLFVQTILLMGVSLWAKPHGVQHFVADVHQSRWEGSSSKLLCSLRHEIPNYGTAIFEQAAGAPLTFRLEVKHMPLIAGMAQVASLPPSWKHNTAIRRLGSVASFKEQAAIRLDAVMTRRLLAELEQGMFPTFSYKDWVDGRDDISVALSAVNARERLEEFHGCLAEVIPFDFEHVEKSKFLYSFGDIGLNAKRRKRLDELAVYLTADESVKEVFIESHTDSKGFRSDNLETSKQRAYAIRDYLIAKGVNPAIFAIRAYGESKPEYSNRTSRGRTLNRRVYIALAK